MIKVFRLIVILTALVSASVSFALQGKVVKIADGDTITVLTVDKQQVKVRLYGIDAPETKQDYGTKSKQYLSKLIFGQVVDVEDLGKDLYGRTIGKVYLDDQYINVRMIEAGMAWWYKTYAKNDKDLSLAQAKAKKQQLGLWALPNPIPPWEFRKTEKQKAVKK